MTTEPEFVFSSLKDLIKLHAPNAELSGIDDIVVSYVVGVVEDAVAGELVDVDGVKELVAAYEPSFGDVPNKEVEEWVERTVCAVKENKQKGKESNHITLDAIVSSFAAEPKIRSTVAPVADVLTAPVQVPNTVKQRKCSTSSTSSIGNTSSSSISSTSSNNIADIDTLLELFPDACRLDVERCLHTAGGDVQEAICIMLDTPLPTINNRLTNIETSVCKPGTGKLVDDKAVKASIMNKYGFIDHDEDHREHRPILPKWEGKKMVRYRDNKVVSLKGERYTEIKKEEPEDLKKSVNLKPGRQYKFH